MAIVHKATISPTKPELATAWLDAQPWGGDGEVELLGSYRFDDPAGDVGVESLLVRRGPDLFQLPLTYRGAPLDGGELVTTMEHSVLGPRWIYLATSDPVGVSCLTRCLSGEQDQAVSEVYEDGRLVDTRPLAVVLTVEEGPLAGAAAPDAAVVETELGRLLVPHVLSTAPGGVRRLVATWDGGGPVVVATLLDA